MTAPGTSPQPGILHPWQANISAKLIRGIDVDVVEEIDYANTGQFYRRRVPLVGGIAVPAIVEVLSRDQLVQLLADLKTERAALPPGVDALGLDVFISLLHDVLGTEEASNRFDHVRFGSVTQDESRGVLYGHYTTGIDVAGTIRDMRHVLSCEQHVVPLPAQAYRPLSRADQSSLARALTAHPPADTLWQEIRGDVQVNLRAVSGTR